MESGGELAAPPTSSFSGLRVYGRALMQTPARLRRRAWAVSTTYEEMSRVRARSGADMRRSLRWPDLVALGLGGMVGAGVFVTTGRAARLYAGPAVVLSYAIAGLCALLSAFCYTEFAVDMPVAGGAFSYLRVTFGEVSLPWFFLSVYFLLCRCRRIRRLRDWSEFGDGLRLLERGCGEELYGLLGHCHRGRHH